MTKQQIGRTGERIACNYLREHGYEIVATNVRSSEGELDIIACEGGTLVFVEVRTRRSRSCGLPEESIGRRKREKLVHLAESYLQEVAEPPGGSRIDVVVVELGKGGLPQRIEVIKNAVEDLH